MPPPNSSEPTPQPFVPPTTPPNIIPTPQRKSPFKIIIVGIILVVVVGGVVALAATGIISLSFFEHAPYTKDHLLTDIVQGLGKIKTTSYSVDLGIHSKPREADAVPFKLDLPQDKAVVDALARDQDRVRDLNQILMGLRNYFYKNKKYPSTLAPAMSVVVPSLANYPYTQTEGGKNFTVTATFESTQAVAGITEYDKKTTVNNKTAIFNKDSSSYIYFNGTVHQPAIVEILNSGDSLSQLPSSMDITTELKGSTQTIASTTNGRLELGVDANFGDALFSFAAELRKIDDTFYVELNKFPSFFGNYSSLKGKWIKITPDDISQYGVGLGYASPDNAQKDFDKRKETAAEMFKLALQIADQDHAIEIKGEPVKETLKNVSVYRYDLILNRANITQFYQDLTNQFAKKYGANTPIKLDPETLDFLKSPAADQVFDYIHKNSSLSIWATPDGIPVKFSNSIRIVPDSKKSIANQLNITVALNLLDINKEVKIEVPTGASSVEDIYMQLSGKTKEQILFEKQTQSINSIGSALVRYKSVTGVFPPSLDELKKKGSEVTKSANMSEETKVMNSYYDTQAFMQAIPNDAYTKAPYTYSSTGSDYSLVYNIALPKYTDGMSLYEIYESSYNPKSPSIYLKYVSGINTASDKVTSQEAFAVSKIDSDKDGVSDSLEDYIGTDKNKKDTDGDGYTDYQEIISGTNPLGPGNQKQSNSF